MISKQQQKYVQSLHNKKYRTEYGKFLVEGEKAILEILNSEFEIENIFCTEIFKEKLADKSKYKNIVVCKEPEIESISTFKTNQTGVAVVNQRNESPNTQTTNSQIILILDGIKDPGNLGTIIRLADWYGIGHVYCSNDTVEFYNPKVIAATMGSFIRVNAHYVELENYIKKLNLPIYGAFLGGKNIHSFPFEKPFGLVIGSESHGISPEIEKIITQKITIPRIGSAESLNAGVATGIILDNIFREI
ncbi:RNA methyltransferase [Lacihabitans sp. CCS-44]|uniref:RNA methyltransferase n=1 Tax=Lacihabitans sp. CCS-44 TaxID=2487331 RepID=UPI0020CBCE68|nr:RNA methyltransferase [Lacihabitans sp. CCS-44]MCP9755874.1 RNA methyltransferase [Lacihabitans sp. CCS-44]